MPPSRIVSPFNPNWFPRPSFVFGQVTECDTGAGTETTVLSYTVPSGRKAHLLLIRFDDFSGGSHLVKVYINGSVVYQYQAYAIGRDSQYYPHRCGTRCFPLAYITADEGDTIEVTITPQATYSYGVGCIVMLGVW